jgi:hypothetical protein
MLAFSAALPAKVRKNAVLCVEYLMTASPEDMHSKTPEQQDAYFADSLDWLRKRHGAENVIYAGVHRDEQTPHMYAYVVPKDPDTGRLNCRRFLGGSAALREMQTDFAEQVGKQHQLERGIEGSKARHTAIRTYYAGVAKSQAEKTVVELPEPSLVERLKPAAYGRRVAESVISQVEPKLNGANAQRIQLQATEKQLKQVNAAAAAASKAARSERARADRYQDVANLFTPAEIERARARRAQQELKEAALAQQAAQEKEWQRRIDVLPGLRRKTAGAEHTFVNCALDAIGLAHGDPSKVEWHKVEGDVVRQAIGQHGQSPESVTQAICKLSPLRANKTEHNQVAAWVQDNAPALQQQYEAQRAINRGLER